MQDISTERGQARSSAVTSLSTETYWIGIVICTESHAFLGSCRQRRNSPCTMAAASRHHTNSLCRFSRVERCHASVLNTFRTLMQSSWTQSLAASRNSHGQPRGQSLAITKHAGCPRPQTETAVKPPTASPRLPFLLEPKSSKSMVFFCFFHS